MVNQQPQKALVIVSRPVPLLENEIHQFEVAYILSEDATRAEIKLPTQRCEVSLCYLTPLNGEQNPIADILRTTQVAREVFDQAITSDAPEDSLRECEGLLESILKNLKKNKCREAVEEAKNCLVFVQEWLKEIQKEGRIYYLNGALYFHEYIDKLSRICARAVINGQE